MTDDFEYPETDDSLDQTEQNQEQDTGPASPSLPGTGVARSIGENITASTAARGVGSALAGEAAGATAVAGTEAVGAGAAIAGIGTTLVIIFFVVLVIIILLVGLIFVLKLLHLSSSGETVPGGPTPTAVPPGGGSTSFASCLYYHQGAPMTLGNPAVAAFISGVADKIDVPPAVVMGVLRIEMSYFFGNPDATHFTNDYFNDKRAYQGPAYGVMQITTPTFNNIFLKHQPILRDPFGKTDSSSIITSSYSYVPNDPVLRIISIRDSIIAGTLYIKELKDGRVGSTAPWNEETVRQIAKGYQGGCDFGYCDNLWKSVRECEFSNAVASTKNVEELVNSVNSGTDSCKHGLTRDNKTLCTSKFSSIDPENRARDAVFAFFRRNPDTINFQCVGFAETAAALQKYPTWTNLLRAKDYADTTVPGYRFIRVGTEPMNPGDIPIWKNGTSGHIAYTLNAFPDGRFIVADANFCSLDCGILKIRNTGVTDGVVGWLRKL